VAPRALPTTSHPPLAPGLVLFPTAASHEPPTHPNTPQNLAAWATAGVAAYFLWVRPEQAKERARVAARAAAANGGAGVDRARPVPDPQIGGAGPGVR